jgi:hypothetical protein
MDGDLRLYPLWPTLNGDMLLVLAHPTSPTTPHYISLSQLAEFIGGNGNGNGGGGEEDDGIMSYVLLTPTDGETITLPYGKVILSPAGPLSFLTLVTPPGVDKWIIRLSTRQRIDMLSLVGAVDWETGELPQNGNINLTYISSLGVWVRA